MAKEASDLRRGNAIRLNGELCIVVELNHVKPGKGPAYLQGRLKNIETGSMRDYRFRMNESVDPVFTERKAVTYSYRAGDDLVFMDSETFEEYTLGSDFVGDPIQYVAEGEGLELVTADGAIVDIAYPDYITRTVTSTPPDVKAAKVTNQVKPATLDTGAEVQVPIFIKDGDRVRLQTATGRYHERVK